MVAEYIKPGEAGRGLGPWRGLCNRGKGLAPVPLRLRQQGLFQHPKEGAVASNLLNIAPGLVGGPRKVYQALDAQMDRASLELPL